MKKKLVNSKLVFTITLMFFVCCFIASSTWAARKVEIIWANTTDFIGMLNQNGASMGQVFGLSQQETFKLIRQNTDFNGENHTRYLQTYAGIPVWGMQVIISRGSDNKVTRLHGAILQDIPKDIAGIPHGSALDPLGALKKMESLHKEKNIAAVWNFTNEEYGTYIYYFSGKAYLCYVVSYFADTDCGNPSKPVYFIDVKSGNVLDSFDSLNYGEGIGPGGNLKVGWYYYGSTYPGFGVTVDGSTCIMDTPDVKTVDLNHLTTGTDPFSYPCYENTHEEINGGFCPMNDAQYFGQVVFDMYMDWYGVPVLPFQLTLRCHYSTDYENAFWDGSTMTFGDGYTRFYPLVGLDVVAHEVSHGFTEYNSNLIYRKESGGINESFSDMAGEAAKFFMRNTNDFMVGYDIFKSPDGALRYMFDPPLDGRSIDHVDDFYPGLDVHYSSGIFNKAFYLIATADGWSTPMAFDIFTKANISYWTTDTSFQQGAEGALEAANFYGYPCQAVVDAFAVVGIPLICAGEPQGDIYVYDITQTVEKVGGNYKSTAVVTIMATNDEPVPDATVTITWSGVVNGSASDITGPDGKVTFVSSKVKSTGPFTITVDNVTHGSLPYNSSLNNETSDTAYYY